MRCGMRLDIVLLFLLIAPSTQIVRYENITLFFDKFLFPSKHEFLLLISDNIRHHQGNCVRDLEKFVNGLATNEKWAVIGMRSGN